MLDVLLRSSTEYKLVAELYGNRCAKRSGVPLINHIHEGLQVLAMWEASVPAKLGYMLHPLVQANLDMELNLNLICRQEMLNTRALMYAMEYRHKANAYLCTEHTDDLPYEQLAKMVGYLHPDVRHMLIADKIQNYKDFMLHHYGTHDRSDQLHSYFHNWFKILAVSKGEVTAATQTISRSKP